MNEFFHTTHEALLVKHLLGETSPEENITVQQWLDADPANLHFYEHFKLIWQQSRRLGNDISLEKDGLEDAAWEKFRQKIRKPSPLSHNHNVSDKGSFPWLRVAATFLLVACLSGIIYFLRHPRLEQRDLVFHTEETVVTDSLPDRSAITLNKRSTLSYTASFNNTDRKVQLQGEAFFQVTHDQEKPFQVYTNGITITVLGTSFNVQDSGKTTFLTVETGAIQVNNAHAGILLHAGEKMELRENDSVLTKTTGPAAFYKYYRPMDFICDHTPLWKLAAALEISYHVKIDITGQAIRDMPISTEFRNESLDHILSVIQETLQIDVTRNGDKIILH